MRTTIDIDDFLLKRLREEARARNIPFKEVVNRVLYRGLESKPPQAPARYVCPTFSMGEPLRPMDRALALADALEDDERAWKLGQRK